MTEASTLAMKLAQLKLDLRKLVRAHTGKTQAFDAAVEKAIDGLNATIIECIDAVHTEIPREA